MHISDEVKLRKHSSVLRAEVDSAPATEDGSPRRIIVEGSYGPMGLILVRFPGQVHRFGIMQLTFSQTHLDQTGLRDNFYLRWPDNTPVERLAMIWQCVEKLDMQVKQDHVCQCIRGYTVNVPVTPEQAIALHLVFGHKRDTPHPKDRTSEWSPLVHRESPLLSASSLHRILT